MQCWLLWIKLSMAWLMRRLLWPCGLKSRFILMSAYYELCPDFILPEPFLGSGSCSNLARRQWNLLLGLPISSQMPNPTWENFFTEGSFCLYVYTPFQLHHFLIYTFVSWAIYDFCWTEHWVLLIWVLENCQEKWKHCQESNGCNDIRNYSLCSYSGVLLALIRSQLVIETLAGLLHT